jgi:hypothetical protein
MRELGQAVVNELMVDRLNTLLGSNTGELCDKRGA